MFQPVDSDGVDQSYIINLVVDARVVSFICLPRSGVVGIEYVGFFSMEMIDSFTYRSHLCPYPLSDVVSWVFNGFLLKLYVGCLMFLGSIALLFKHDTWLS